MERAHDNKNSKTRSKAFQYYVKVYCNRKASKKPQYSNKLIEAIKSFASLSDAEKQVVNSKIAECTEKYTTQCLEQLKVADIFMKAKDNLSNSNEDETVAVNNTKTEVCQDNVDVEFANTTDTDTDHLTEIHQINTSDKISVNEDLGSHLNEPVSNISEIEYHQEEENEDSTKNEDIVIPPQPILIEPLPPTVKTGQQLFFMLNSTDENDRTSWASLTQKEKNQYGYAVCIMKKDYITKYREYLESLSSEELFEHYHKTIF